MKCLDLEILASSVSRLPLRDITVISENSSVKEALNALVTHKIGAIPMVDEDGGLAGIVSERDLVRAINHSNNVDETLASVISSFATLNVKTIAPNDTIAYSLQLMSLGGFRHVPIVTTDASDRIIPLSILSVRDVVDFIVAELNKEILL